MTHDLVALCAVVTILLVPKAYLKRRSEGLVQVFPNGEPVPQIAKAFATKGAMQTESSLLARKAPVPEHPGHPAGRFIPAHAGSTTQRYAEPPHNAAHPRSRGEHGYQDARRALYAGSSPLTRGAHPKHLHRHPRHRLIPAHAGSTACSPPSSCSSGAHPRSRGEHSMYRGSRAHRVGSSPLTRGAHPIGVAEQIRRRLIPAHAGSTVSRFRHSHVPLAHPRSRGEHCHHNSTPLCQLGSSPLTRGARAGEG
ncbi:hypothetical protein HMPREF9004_1137 [Schaalia cardiffensis F0333]|uniref:Uncharacterized protein n=1 Tax=Schaalia cardiffensis F0333 TaxID=888050 RepID=N6X324_9ACTO|nr:hypothetical protein HMPREF9004_1137 [Schaalia cardiffensis F0333]